jgi:hypothetical protein
MHKQYDPGIDTLIDNVVQFGSHYRMEQMDTLYTADQSILFLSGDKTVTRVPRDAMMAECITFSCGTTNAPTPCNDDLCRYGCRPVVDISPLPKRIEPNCLGPLLVGANVDIST